MLASPPTTAKTNGRSISKKTKPDHMTKRKNSSLKKSGALLATALLTGSLTSSFAGEAVAKSTGAKTATDRNPLSFADGLLTQGLRI